MCLTSGGTVAPTESKFSLFFLIKISIAFWWKMFCLYIYIYILHMNLRIWFYLYNFGYINVLFKLCIHNFLSFVYENVSSVLYIIIMRTQKLYSTTRVYDSIVIVRKQIPDTSAERAAHSQCKMHRARTRSEKQVSIDRSIGQVRCDHRLSYARSHAMAHAATHKRRRTVSTPEGNVRCFDWDGERPCMQGTTDDVDRSPRRREKKGEH